ncbi:hypothetical protein [Clostridium senegalense]|uniref:hypothetical protein n=1 Tax=Clostridium senegalense TaxID=1465809 RepID=UPI00028916EC|nr:hypothetical protein [Clostridium senegalense]
MEKSKRYYTKAIKNYDMGNLSKAIDYCNKSLKEDRGNSASLNLKGLIYYLKGDLESGRNQWKINFKVNSDEISRKYLNDSRNDRDRLEKFREGQRLLKEIKVKEALSIFESLKNSHFNFINLYNNIALCYVRLGEYDTAYYHVKQVLNFDNSNKFSYEIIKSLQDIGAIKHKDRLRQKKIITILAIVGMFLLITSGTYYFAFRSNSNVALINEVNSKNQKKKSEEDVKSEKNDIENKKDEKIDEKIVEDNSKEKVEEKKVFPFNEFNTALSNKDYETIIKDLNEFKVDELNVNDKTLYIKGMELINSEAVEIYYKKALEYMSKKDYKSSINTLNKVYKYSDGIYLNEHIIYMMAVSYESQSDIANALKWYEEYNNKYKDGSYIEGVIYKLAILNKDIDLNKAKQYASDMSDNYSESQYNNSKIKEIINK